MVRNVAQYEGEAAHLKELGQKDFDFGTESKEFFFVPHGKPRRDFVPIVEGVTGCENCKHKLPVPEDMCHDGVCTIPKWCDFLNHCLGDADGLANTGD
jgi:hypothetical protein